MKRYLCALMAAGMLVGIAPVAFGQGVNTKATLTGAVQDSTGAVVPGATVVIKGSDVLKDGWVQVAIPAGGPGAGGRGGAAWCRGRPVLGGPAAGSSAPTTAAPRTGRRLGAGSASG